MFTPPGPSVLIGAIEINHSINERITTMQNIFIRIEDAHGEELFRQVWSETKPEDFNGILGAAVRGQFRSVAKVYLIDTDENGREMLGIYSAGNRLLGFAIVDRMESTPSDCESLDDLHDEVAFVRQARTWGASRRLSVLLQRISEIHYWMARTHTGGDTEHVVVQQRKGARIARRARDHADHYRQGHSALLAEMKALIS